MPLARRLLLVAMLAGCNAGSADFVEFVKGLNEAGAKSIARDKAVTDCAKEDFRAVGAMVRALVGAGLGAEPGPVRTLVELPGGALMDLEISGMDGTGPAPGTPLVLTFAWSLVGGEDGRRTGDLALTLEPDGRIVLSDHLSVPLSCVLFKLTSLEMRLDPDLLPALRPTGTARLEAVAENLFVVLDAAVTFDGAGGAVVEGWVDNYGVAHAADFSVSLD